MKQYFSEAKPFFAFQWHITDECDQRCKHCYIFSGDVYACRRVADSKVGNVFIDRLADVWVCEMERYREYDSFKKCGKCELKAWCRGCPAVAKGTNGDFYEADPQCLKEIKEVG